MLRKQKREWCHLMTSASFVEESSSWAKYHSMLKGKEL